MMWNKFGVFLLLMICFSSARAQQPDPAFIQHLVKYNLQAEHEHYLFGKFSSDEVNPLLQQYRMRFLLHSEKDSLFISRYLTAGLAADSLLIRSANAYFLNPLRFGHKMWFEELNTGIPLVQNAPEFTMFQKAWHSKDSSLIDIPYHLHDSYRGYLAYRDKKPWKAALYSALIPGTGKLYAGHKRAFFPNFLMHAAMGLQSAESISKHGIKSAISIVNLSVFAFYYASNIYGSARAVKTKQKEYRYQFLLEASEYYDSKCNCDLY